MSTPKRFAKGVTNVKSGTTMGNCIIPDPTSVAVWMEDFHKFDPGEWIVTRNETAPAYTSIGLAGSSEKISDAQLGILAVVTAAADDDYSFFQKGDSGADGSVSESWTLTAGQKLWFKARLKANDVDTCDLIVGLKAVDTTPLATHTDGVWFQSDDGDAYLDFYSYSSSASVITDTNIGTIADDTFFTCGFYFDGNKHLYYYFNDEEVAQSTSTNTTNEIAVTFGIQNGSAAASTLSMDYICVVQERP
jgi:hypothetical protein